MSKWSCSKKDGLEVCLDIELTPELIAEGKINDEKRKVAMERKKLDNSIKAKCPYLWNEFFCLKNYKEEYPIYYRLRDGCIPRKNQGCKDEVLCDFFKENIKN